MIDDLLSLMNSDRLRKLIRGLVETVFGGMETETGNKIRFRLDRTRRTYLSLRALAHEIRTYFRAIAHKAIAFFRFQRNNPPVTENYINMADIPL